MRPEIIICVGTPLAGKSTFAKEQEKKGYHTICRDTIRENLAGIYSNYQFTRDNENKVTKVFNYWFEQFTNNNYNIVLDNTHCKEAYINEWISRRPLEYTIRIKFFDIPLWKAYYRNVIRYFKIGKWIPFKVIRDMKTCYDKIPRDKYDIYL